MIYTITLNPAIDRTILIDEFKNKELITVQRTIRQAAGKGINVSRVLHQIGVNSTVVTLLAGRNGEYIAKELEERNMPFIHRTIAGETRENIKIVPQNGTVVELNDVGPLTTMDDVTSLLHQLIPLLTADDLVVLTGSVPQGLPQNIYQTMLTSIQPTGATTLLDASKDALIEGLKARPDIIKPNIHELSDIAGEPITSIEEAIVQGKQLVQQGIHTILITMGKDSTIYLDEEHIYQVEPLQVDVVNTVGAGDTFIAGYLKQWSEQKTVIERLHYATALSTCSVMSDQTGPTALTLLDELLSTVPIKEIPS